MSESEQKYVDSLKKQIEDLEKANKDLDSRLYRAGVENTRLWDLVVLLRERSW